MSFVFAAIFGIAFFSTYEQRTDLGHSVHVSPTSASYGTVSTVHPQALAVPMQSSAPMLSGGAIRSYAYSGHATMPKASSAGSNFKMYTTSSASVHSLGSGGGGGGGSMGGGSSYGGSSSKGIRYGGASVSMPSLAFATPTYSSSNTNPMGIHARNGLRPRRVIDNGDGTYTGEYVTEPSPDGTQYWDGEDWVDYADGATRTDEYGVSWIYHIGEGWSRVGDQSQPGVPIGDAPWLWMLLLAIAYVSAKVLRKRMTGLSTITID